MTDPAGQRAVGITAVARVEDGPGTWGHRSHGEPVEVGSWAAIERAIQRLDGASYNELTISRCLARDAEDSSQSDCENLSVGGGEDGRVSVIHVATRPNGIVFHMAVQRDRGEKIETRTIGGQGSDLPSKRWVSKDVALRAVRSFMEHGGMAPDMDWEFDFLDPGGAPLLLK